SPSHTEQAPLDADAYVVPQELHAYDLKSARELAGKTVWVRAGYGVAVYPYDSGSKRADFAKEAGSLGPIQKLEIKDVVSIPWQHAKDTTALQSQLKPGLQLHVISKQVMAIFQRGGKNFAFPVGFVDNGD